MQNCQQINPSIKFSCRRFNFNDDPNLILDWMEQRKLEIPNKLELPKIGFVIKTKQNGAIAIGFLRICEGNVAMIDSMITNPAINSDIRDKALDFLVHRLIASARRKNIFKIFGYSMDKNTLLRAQKHGFKIVSQTLIALQIS